MVQEKPSYFSSNFSNFLCFSSVDSTLLSNMSTGTLRSSDNKLTVLDETPGPDDLKIRGSRLPSYKQVHFCYLSNLEILKENDESKQQSLERPCAKLVLKEVLYHYTKACIPTQEYEHKMEEKIINFHLEYCSLFQIKPGKRSESQKIKDFQAKLKLTMPFWPRIVEKMMIGNSKNKSQKEKEAIEEDILFLRSMN